jgi:DNA-3-methyladenine glycosylase
VGALPRPFFERTAAEVAPELLNKVLRTADGRSGRIVEVEAYIGASDPGSHAYRGLTRRNATLFGPAGHLYVYLSYGLHWCANAVCADEGVGEGVLIRALEPVAGLAAMRAARWSSQRRQLDVDLCRGPGRLAQALGLDGTFDGADLVTADRGTTIVADGTPPPTTPVRTTRIGLSDGADLPLRWYVGGSRYVSRRTVVSAEAGAMTCNLVTDC